MFTVRSSPEWMKGRESQCFACWGSCRWEICCSEDGIIAVRWEKARKAERAARDAVRAAKREIRKAKHDRRAAEIHEKVDARRAERDERLNALHAEIEARKARREEARREPAAKQVFALPACGTNEAKVIRELTEDLERDARTAAMAADVPTIDFPEGDGKYDSSKKYGYAQ